MKLGAWLKGFAAALLGGVVNGVVQAAASNSMQPSQIKGAVIAGAILTAGAYLTRSPLGGAAIVVPANTAAANTTAPAAISENKK